jgi:hypothetical protein
MLRLPLLAVEAATPSGLPRGRLLAGAVRDDGRRRAETAWRRRGRILRRNPSRQERRPCLLQGRPGRRRPGPGNLSSTLYYGVFLSRLPFIMLSLSGEKMSLFFIAPLVPPIEVLEATLINQELVKRCELF